MTCAGHSDKLFLMNCHQRLSSVGIKVPSILLPAAADLSKWPVIACDQYTQDREYWDNVKNYISASPSTLNLIFPEVYLENDDAAGRISDIHSNMKRYLQDGVFAKPRGGFIYVERDTPYKKTRRGLIAAVDLEHYDWHSDSRFLIRSTEGTVPERLPPRMDIRRGAPVETPHILLLIDDKKNEFLPGLGERAKKNVPVYSTPLMMDSGNVTGWFINDESDFSFIADKLDELYRSLTAERFLFAVGDGNHSLAAAKGIWNEIKKGLKEQEKEIFHPGRYALVEIENIYDPALQFEPIHRLVFDIEYEKIISLLSELPGFSMHTVNGERELSSAVSADLSCSDTGVKNRFGVISRGRTAQLTHYAIIETSAAGISTACLQPLLDKYAKDNPYLIDYIHDEKELFRLSVAGNRRVSGILLPPVQKSGLFETVARHGPLPRKSFSMGRSSEKRFYLECRSLLE